MTLLFFSLHHWAVDFPKTSTFNIQGVFLLPDLTMIKTLLPIFPTFFFVLALLWDLLTLQFPDMGNTWIWTAELVNLPLTEHSFAAYLIQSGWVWAHCAPVQTQVFICADPQHIQKMCWGGIASSSRERNSYIGLSSQLRYDWDISQELPENRTALVSYVQSLGFLAITHKSLLTLLK